MRRFIPSWVPSWQALVVIACLLVMAAGLIFVFLVSNGAFVPVGS